MVARVGGPARAGGLGLIAAADIAVCARDATFAFSEVRHRRDPGGDLGDRPARGCPAGRRRAVPDRRRRSTAPARPRSGWSPRPSTRPSWTRPSRSYTAALVRGAPGALAGAKALLRRDRRRLRSVTTSRMLTAMSVGYFGSDEGREGMAAFRDKARPVLDSQA